MAVVDDFIYEYTRLINNLKAINTCIDATGRYHDDLGRFTTKMGWFVDGVLNGTLQPLTNAINVGNLESNVVSYLERMGIKVGKTDIDLTFGKIKHTLRDTKKATQKVSKEQLKRAIDIITQNNVFYDSEKKNIIYISELPTDEIKNNRNWIKIPVEINKKDDKNYIITMSIIKAEDIINHTKYKKID